MKKNVVEKLLDIVHLLYVLRTELLILFLTFMSCMVVSGSREIRGILVIGLICAIFNCAVKATNKLYMKRLSTKRGTVQRYTYLDKGGNPSIRVEDLPQIIQYLYELEEESSGR